MDNLSETINNEEVKSDTAIFNYLEQHIDNFNPSKEEREFISSKLKFANGKISIGGWLILPYIGMAIDILFCLIAIFSSLLGNFTLISGIILAYGVYLAFLTYHMVKKTHTAIILFKISCAIGIASEIIIANIDSLNLNAHIDILNLMANIVWLIYFFVSKRVKYTFVE